jgi:hypothetical protein
MAGTAARPTELEISGKRPRFHAIVFRHQDTGSGPGFSALSYKKCFVLVIRAD